MNQQHFLPSTILRPYISHYSIHKSNIHIDFRVLPSTYIVMGIQLKGSMSLIQDDQQKILSKMGITGIVDTYQIFQQSAETETILIYFNPIGFNSFQFLQPAIISNSNLSLEHFISQYELDKLNESLSIVQSENEIIKIIDNFLLSKFKPQPLHPIVNNALLHLNHHNGNISVHDLAKKVFTSMSNLEKCFKKQIGLSPKKISNILRVNALLKSINNTSSTKSIYRTHEYYDNSHFCHSFRKFTGFTLKEYLHSRNSDFLQ